MSASTQDPAEPIVTRRTRGRPLSTPTDDLGALHGQAVEVEQVHVTEDCGGIPSWIRVERELGTVVIVPSLLRPPTPRLADPTPQHQEGVTP